MGDDHDSRYIDDYFAAFSVDEASLCSVPDTWEHYERLAPAIDARYARWVREGRPQFVVWGPSRHSARRAPQQQTTRESHRSVTELFHSTSFANKS